MTHRPVRTHSLRAAPGLAAGALLVASLGACAGNNRDSDLGAAPAQNWRLSDAQRSAMAAQEASDPRRAIELYREAVSFYPEFFSAWNNLGVLLMEQQLYYEAAEAFAAAAEYAPRDPRPVYNLGLAWDRVGYLDDALRFYKQSLERDPRFLPALRGALRIEDILQIRDDSTLDRLRFALSQEPDPVWREAFELQKAKVEREIHPPIGGMYNPETSSGAGAPRSPSRSGATPSGR